MLEWLVQGLARGARLLLHGAPGMGKTSVLMHAADRLAQRPGFSLVRLDLGSHASLSTLVSALGRAVDALASGARQDVLRPLHGLGQGTSAPATPGTDLFGMLDRANQVCGQARHTLVFAFDDFPELRRLGGALMEQGLRDAFQRHGQLGYVLSGAESRMAAILHDTTHPLRDQLQSASLEPVDSRRLAAWIDQRFSELGTAAIGVGDACVELGGPRTSDVIQLARRTFDLAENERWATAATVSQALHQSVSEKSQQYGEVWGRLSQEEKAVVKRIALGDADGLPTPDPRTPGRAQRHEPTRAAVKSLMDRGLVEKIGSAGLRLESPALRGWAVQADLAVTRERPAESARPSTRFSFDFRVTPPGKKTQAIGL